MVVVRVKTVQISNLKLLKTFLHLSSKKSQRYVGIVEFEFNTSVFNRVQPTSNSEKKKQKKKQRGCKEMKMANVVFTKIFPQPISLLVEQLEPSN